MKKGVSKCRAGASPVQHAEVGEELISFNTGCSCWNFAKGQCEFRTSPFPHPT